MGSLRKRFKKAIVGMVTDRQEVFKNGLAEGLIQNYEEAIELFDHVAYLTIGNDDVKKEAMYYKACALSELDKNEEAIKVLKCLIEIEKDDESALSLLGNIYSDMERFEEALECYNECLRINSKDVSHLTDKAETLLELEKNEEALEYVEKALEIDPNDSQALYQKCSCLVFLNRLDEVIKLSKKIQTIEDEDDTLTNFTLATAYSLMEDYEKAIECVEKALKDEPTDDILWYNKACYLSMFNKKEEALDALLVATSMEPKNLIEMREEEDFKNIRETERFQKLMNKII